MTYSRAEHIDHILLINPYHVMRKHKAKAESFLWNSFLARVIEIRATDLDNTPTAIGKDRPTAKKEITQFRPCIIPGPKPSTLNSGRHTPRRV